MSSSTENEDQVNKTEDRWMSHGARYEIRENEPALDFEHLDGASDVQALLCELEAGLGITLEMEDLSLPLGVDKKMGVVNPLSGPGVNLGCAIQGGNAEGPSPSSIDPVLLPPQGASNFALTSGSASQKEVIDLTGEEEDERVSQTSVRKDLLQKRDLGKNPLQPQRPPLPFSPSLVGNCQTPRNSKSTKGAALSRLSVPVHGGGFSISPLLPDPTAITMDTLWDFSASQPPDPLYPTTMPELMAPQPKRYVQDFQISDNMIAKPVGLGITMDAISVGPDGGFGAVSSIDMDRLTYSAPLSTIEQLTNGIPERPGPTLGPNPVDLWSIDAASWGKPLAQSRTSNVDTLSAAGGSSLGPAVSLRPASPVSLAGVPPGQSSNLSPKKQTRTSTSSWPDFVMAHYNPRSYSNPPVLHGSPIKIKQPNGPISGTDLKIVSTRYPFPSRGETKLPKTPEKKRKATYPDAPTIKATPSPARPPNIGQSRKVVQAFAAQKAERNEERARTGTIGPASLNQEKASRKREKNGGKLGEYESENNGAKDPKLNEGGLAAEGVANVPHDEWSIFGGVGAEIQSGVTVGAPVGALQGAAIIEEGSSGLALPPIDEWVSAFLGAPGTSVGPASLPAPQPLFNYPLSFNPPNSYMPTVQLSSHLGEVDPAFWPVEFAEPFGPLLSGVIPEPILADQGEGSLLAGQKRALEVHSGEDKAGRAAKRVRI
ncbi:hypothetical protein M407DRAFT_232351 [Tulasnella calospora MUT 4182]|uniref:Uncharacterized protein n=1 Tax=Tulasnella calospora MUT 4182 TaxID=1051891 RepID=A0A0C3QB84_9AGAM|nr:hypothetical protein M407DRAFT_232351 [Tulasnella calospora MUT 4182]